MSTTETKSSKKISSTSTKKFSSEKKKNTVRISKKDLLAILSENEAMVKQITELQARMNEMLEENRQLKAEKTSEPADKIPEDALEDLQEVLLAKPSPNPWHSRSDIYFDGSNHGGGQRYGSK